jgi:S1-C subfamily serine protease
MGTLRSMVWTGEARPRLGVWVQSEANPETDRYGALIEDVMEGGPADKAGLKEDDIITALDGVSLLSGDEEYDEDVSAPGRRLVERSREFERGDTVAIEYRRDGETRTVDLVIGEFEGPFMYSFGAQMPHADRVEGWVERLREVPEVHVSGPQTFALRLGARWPGLELASLNPQLGEYFGTEEGVLVLSVPEDSQLNLAAGDVIQSIDNRAVKSPSHAMRILRSYDADEEVSFNIVRQQRSMSVSGKVSEPVSPNTVRIERR